MSSGIGFLALFGVSVQTAIVYISYVNELRRTGMRIAEATSEAALLRLRPIMMTALVAALGLLPAALSTGVGSDSQRPFALVIVGGLFSRLLISVYLMPALYLGRGAAGGSAGGVAPAFGRVPHAAAAFSRALHAAAALCCHGPPEAVYSQIRLVAQEISSSPCPPCGGKGAAHADVSASAARSSVASNTRSFTVRS